MKHGSSMEGVGEMTKESVLKTGGRGAAPMSSEYSTSGWFGRIDTGGDADANPEVVALARGSATSIGLLDSRSESGHIIAPNSEAIQSFTKAESLAHENDVSDSKLVNVELSCGMLLGGMMRALSSSKPRSRSRDLVELSSCWWWAFMAS